VTGVLHFHAIKALRRKRRDSLTRAARARMREHREAAGRVNHADCVGHHELLLGDIRGTSRSKIAIKGITHVSGPAVPDKSTRNVRAPNSASASVCEHVIEGDQHAVCVELLHDRERPPRPHLAQCAKLPVEHSGIGEMKAEEMRLGVTFDGAQLDAVDDTNAKLLTHRTRLGETGDGIMVGQRDGEQTRGMRRADDVRR
jgi:hypothetical protein